MSLTLELTKKLRPYEQDRFLLAVSGGRDSMALLALFLHFRQHFSFQFAVAHFHHGPAEDISQQEFRRQAYQMLANECENQNIEFFSNVEKGDVDALLSAWSEPLKSEKDFREARYQFFEKVRDKDNFQWLVLAHHQEDLLETQLIRLIRGTGPSGLQSMSFIEGWRMRPLLDVSPQQLDLFLSTKKINYLEDPSNKDLGPFRNWLRHFWLQELENKRPGAKRSLFRSLDHLVSSLDQSEELNTLAQEDSLNLSEVLALSESEKRQVLAAYMKSQGLRNYGLSHINEVLKRLDNEKKRHTFKMLGRRWKVDAGRMSLEPTH